MSNQQHFKQREKLVSIGGTHISYMGNHAYTYSKLLNHVAAGRERAAEATATGIRAAE